MVRRPTSPYTLFHPTSTRARRVALSNQSSNSITIRTTDYLSCWCLEERFEQLMDMSISRTISSSPPQTAPSTGILSSNPSSGNFAFFVHSQESLRDNSSPSSGSQSQPRAKRKRTRQVINAPAFYVADSNRVCSPEDHAILEAEYQRNPKPDKSARSAIVARVALGEKEVQVSIVYCSPFILTWQIILDF